MIYSTVELSNWPIIKGAAVPVEKIAYESPEKNLSPVKKTGRKKSVVEYRIVGQTGVACIHSVIASCIFLSERPLLSVPASADATSSYSKKGTSDDYFKNALRQLKND